MGFLDYFIEKTDDPTPVGKTSVPPIGQSVPSIPSNTQPVYTTPVYTTPISQPDLAKFEAHFDELFNKANLPGPDYYEFIQMTKAMVTLTDDVKFPAVFSALQVQGLTKEKLLQTAQQYVGVIEADAQQFNSAIDTKIVGEIKKKKENLASMQASIKQKEDMIKQLQTDIVNENANIMTITEEIVNDERKYNEKTVVYKTACDNRKQAITNDIQKINSYIK